jgi:hypothetical protein
MGIPSRSPAFFSLPLLCRAGSCQAFLVRGWPALTEKTMAGIHFFQEDSPDEIGKAIVEWMGTLG